MAIEIIVEDGSIVDGANSFLSLADAKLWANNRGVILPSNDDEIAIFLIKAGDFINSKEFKFKGEQVELSQSMSWPRTNVFLNCKKLPDNFIPKQIKEAQLNLMQAASEGMDLQPNINPSTIIKKDKVDVLETEFFGPSEVGILPIFSSAEALLKMFYAFSLNVRNERAL